MRNYTKLLLTFFALLVINAEAIDRQRSLAKEFPFLAGAENYVKNPSCLKDTADITDAGGALSKNTTSPLTQEADCQLNNAITNAVKWEIDSLPKILDGQNCEGIIFYTGTAANTWSLEFEVDGTDVIKDNDLLNTDSGKVKKMSFNYPCPVGSTNFVELDGAGATSGNTNVAGVYFGPATNIGSVAQAEVLVAAGISADQNITTTSQTTIEYDKVSGSSAAGEFADPYNGLNTSTGVWTAPFDAEVIVTYDHRYIFATDGNNFVSRVLLNGTSARCQSNAVGDANTATYLSVSGCRLSLSSGDTLQVQTTSSSDSNYDIDNDYTRFSVIKIPTESEQVQRLGAPGQDWTAYTPVTQGLGTISSVDFEYQCVQGNAYIQAEFTTGTVTASEMQIGLPSGLTVAGNSGKRMKVGDILRPSTSTGAPFNAIAVEGRTYLTFGVGGTPQGDLNANSVVGNSEAVLLNALVPVNGCPRTSVPLVKNAVTLGGSSGLYKVEGSAKALCSTSSSITINSLGMMSAIGNRSGGKCDITLASGFFSGTPECHVSPQNNSTPRNVGITVNSATDLDVDCTDNSDTGVNCTFQLTCWEYR